MLGLYGIMSSIIRAIVHGGKKSRFRQLSVFVLCIALLAGTFPMDAWAAQDNTLSQDETLSSKEILQDTVNYASVSMSDPGLMPDLTAAASPVAESEYIQLQVTVPDSQYSDGILTLGNESAAFVIEPELNGSTINTPILKISIPSCMEVTNYPDETNELLQSNLALTDPVSKEVQDGYTIITYRFIPHLTRVKFAINAQIPSGYPVQDGNSYQIKLDIYDDATLLASKEEIFTIAMQTGKISLSNAMQKTQELYEDTTSYYVGSYTWRLTANSGHYPYTSLKMIVPLPSGAVPGTGDHDMIFDALPVNTPKSFSGYSVTYCPACHYQSDDGSVSGNADVLIYKLTPGNKFLTSDTSVSFNQSFTEELYLRFTNPQSGTYQSPASPRIECGIGDQTVTMLDYGTTNLTSVTFTEESPEPKETTIRPYNSWHENIYLKENVSVYDTGRYVRDINVDSTVPAAYDSLKMTVPLPEGAVPGFGTDSSFIPLVDGTTEPLNDDRTLWVTYAQNRSYSSADGSIHGNADMLIYEFRPFQLMAGSTRFEMWLMCTRFPHLRFTNPSAGTYQSASSPKIEVTLNGTTTTMYDFNDTDYLTSVEFLEPQEGDIVYPDFNINEGKGWSDTLTLEKDKTVYYTSAYNRAVYSSSPHYPYDLVRMTVLLPDEAVPGFGSEESFAPLEDGKTYTNAIQSEAAWTVTYHEQYSYANKEGTVTGTAKALIYEISSELFPSNYFLTRGSSFFFMGTQPEQILHLRFTNPESKTYCSVASPKVEYIMDGKTYETDGYFSQTESDTSVTFEPVKTDWSKLTVSGSTNKTLYGLDQEHNNPDYLIPEDYQNNKEYYGSITNQTGDFLTNIQVLYEFDQDLNVDKLTFHLGESGYPKNAVVVYTSSLDGTEHTASLNASDNILSLDTGNAFVTAKVTFDALDDSDTPRKVLTASLHNYRKTPSVYQNITATALSADNGSGSSDDKLTSSDTTLIRILNEYNDLRLSPRTAPLTLNKGDDFTVSISLLSRAIPYQQNLTLYLRMPKGYLLTDYTPPEECKDGEYYLTSRALEDGDILYCLEYTDNAMYKMYYDSKHIFSFYIGLEADTSVYQKIPLPKAIYATMKENALFQFTANGTHIESDIGLDVNGDGDMEDSFYMPYTDTVEVNSMELLELMDISPKKDRPKKPQT